MRRTGARAHVLHLSDAGSLDLIRAAKAEGLPLTVETCPHYLALRAEDVPDGGDPVQVLPAHPRRRQPGPALGRPCSTARSTRSCPTTRRPRPTSRARDGDFGLSWGGIAGLQLGLSVVWTEARAAGSPLDALLPLFTTGPARMAGLDGGRPRSRAPRAPGRVRARRGARGRRARPRAQEPGLALRRRDPRRAVRTVWLHGAPDRAGRRRPPHRPPRRGRAVRERSGLAVRVPQTAATSASTPANSIPTPTPRSPPTCSSSAPTPAPTRISATASERRAQPSPEPPASRESAASPVSVDVTTTVVTSLTASRRAVAACSPIATASSVVTTSAQVVPCPGGATSAPIAEPDREHAGRRERQARAVRPARRGGAQHASAERGTGQEADQRERRAQDRQVVGARERHAEDDHVPGHVRGEHPVQPEVADGVDDARRERQCQHEHQVSACVVPCLHHGVMVGVRDR